MPPKRTSSFREQHSQSPQVSAATMATLPETRMDNDVFPDPNHPRLPEWTAVPPNPPAMDDSLTSFTSADYNYNRSHSSSEEMLTQHKVTNSGAPAVLAENHSKSRSSSEELLSTPGSCSHTGSLERILEHKLLTQGQIDRSRSNSHDQGSRSGSSPLKSSEQKTPDTDVSDPSSLPPPPPCLLQSPLVEPPLAIGSIVRQAEVVRTRSSAKVTERSPSPEANVPDALPLGHLRESLRKTRTYPDPRANNGHVLDYNTQEIRGGVSSSIAPGVGALQSENIQAISRYSTIPKNARVGAFLASLNQEPSTPPGVSLPRKESQEFPPTTPKKKTNVEEDERDTVSLSNYPQMPTPEVKRKVEEWRAGVEKSMLEERQQQRGKSKKPPIMGSASLRHGLEKYATEQQNVPAAWKPEVRNQALETAAVNCDNKEHNVKPSAFITKSASAHSLNNLSAVGDGEKPSNLISRNKSDVSSSCGQQQKTQNIGTGAYDRGSGELQKQKPKPVPSPRFQNKTPSKDNSKSQIVAHNREVSTSSEEGGFVNVGTEMGDSFHEAFAVKRSPPVLRRTTGSGEGYLSETRAKFKVQDHSGSHSRQGSLDSPENPKSDRPAFVQKSEFQVLPRSPPAKNKLRKSKGEEKKKPSSCQHREARNSDKVKQVNQEFPNKVSTLPGTFPKQALLPPGYKPPSSSTPTSKQGVAIISSPSQLPGRNALHHVDTSESASSATKSAIMQQTMETTDKTVTKESVTKACRGLAGMLESLNTVQSKHASNFVHLSDEVDKFYTLCQSYVESLPPHGKFQFRELLVTLQNISDSLKTSSGGNINEYDKLMGNLQKAVSDIDLALKNINIQKIRDKV